MHYQTAQGHTTTTGKKKSLIRGSKMSPRRTPKYFYGGAMGTGPFASPTATASPGRYSAPPTTGGGAGAGSGSGGANPGQ